MGSAADFDLTVVPAMATNPRFIFFTDFDGTVTQQDSNDYMTDNMGFGQARRKALGQDVLHKRRTFRSAFGEELESVATPFDECMRILLEKIKLDEGFKEFAEWARDMGVPIVVLSGGMTPMIKELLAKLLGKEMAESMQVVSNDVKFDDSLPGGWGIQFRDESDHGHDKSLELRKYSSLPNRPIMFYAGDGVSDLSAARETDLMFAKAGCDLVTYCETEMIPFAMFKDFRDILKVVKAVVGGELKIEDAATGRQ